jgi:hypothetical protein
VDASGKNVVMSGIRENLHVYAIDAMPREVRRRLRRVTVSR